MPLKKNSPHARPTSPFVSAFLLAALLLCAAPLRAPGAQESQRERRVTPQTPAARATPTPTPTRTQATPTP
ncbi:MAG TPA: hypothetical protein VF611_07830, partial [Pyrinomonadaceae bacterium]